ncbi:MAG TPA: dihydrofolate reductase family protein [Cytophagales bacterium]|nr:dihydrofolate reductase family protein [Cytophagales bacterium]
MRQRKVVVYVAMSIDGYIAKEDEAMGLLPMLDNGSEDYAYAEFIKTIDTVVIGKDTYEQITLRELDYLNKDKKYYVLDGSSIHEELGFEFYKGDIKSLVATLKQSQGKDIFFNGGAELIQHLLELNMIDKLIITVIPILLGDGIRLFPDGRPEQKLKLISGQIFTKGLVQLWYEK